MMKKMLWMGLMVPMMLVAFSSSASAVLIQELVDEPFSPDGAGSFSVTVTSQVHLVDGGMYRYSYQITSTDTQITWFAIALLDDNTMNYNPGVGANVPDLWQYVNPLSAKAVFFSDPIMDGEVSAVISFDSRFAPADSTAKVTGLNSGSLSGNVLVPIPEPATLAILVMGGVGIVMKRKRC